MTYFDCLLFSVPVTEVCSEEVCSEFNLALLDEQGVPQADNGHFRPRRVQRGRDSGTHRM